MPCETGVCGTGGYTGPQPGDPDTSNVAISATPAFGGIDVTWSYPAINPHAVAHTQLYRGISNTFELAFPIAVVAGNFYYDKLDTGTTYFYWVRIVSANTGVMGDPIGPASATARPLIGDLIEQLTGQIDAGVLANSLKTELGRITENDLAIQQALATALSGDTALAAAITAVQTTADTLYATVDDEIAARIAANTALVSALNAHALSIQQEVIDRANADNDAIALEAIARTTQAQQAAYTALSSLLASDIANLAAASTVAIARTDLHQAIDDGISAEAGQRLLLAAKLDTVQADTLALISAEETARVNAVSAEATSRELLATQFRGAYAGTNPDMVTEGLLFNERTIRSAREDALAQQITLLSAGAGEQFDWAKIWYFDSDAEGWTGNGTPVVDSSWLRPANQASNVYVESPTGIGTLGTRYSQLRLRIRKYGIPVFAGYVWWRGANDATWDESRRFTLIEPGEYVSGIGLITANPGWTTTVDQIRIELSGEQTDNNHFSIDWVAIGRPSPGASSAQLLEEQLARISADSSLANDYSTLNAKIGDTDSGIVKDIATIVRDYSTKANVDSAVASAQTSLMAHFGPSMVFREPGVAQAVGADTGGPVQIINHTPVTLKDGTTAYLPKISIGNVWYNTANGNKPHTWAGVDGWVYTPDLSTTASNAFSDNIQTVFTAAGIADISLISSTIASVNDPITGLLATQAVNSSDQTAIATQLGAVSTETRTLVAKGKGTDNTLLRNVLTDAQSKEDLQQTIAIARQDLSTKIEDGLSAEATARLSLTAIVNENSANALQVQTANVTTQQAIASNVATLTASVSTQNSTNDARFSQIEGTVDTHTATLVEMNSVIANNAVAEAQKRTTLQSTLNGQIATAQTNLQTNIDTVDGKVTEMGAQYTAVLSANGLVGGFGVYNDGSTVEAGFDVDKFWVGRTNDDKRRPFIIQDGEVFINQAVINTLTFDKLRAADGSVIVNNGKLNATHIDTSEIFITSGGSNARMEITSNAITVYDAAGNVRVKIGNLA